MFDEILKNKNLTIKDISIGAELPRSTISDLVGHKTHIEKMSTGNLYKLSHYFGLNMQDFYEYCLLPNIGEAQLFIDRENHKILDNGLKAYVKALEKNNLIETSYALNDNIRFQKYMGAVRDFYKYRKLILPERYVDYVLYLED